MSNEDWYAIIEEPPLRVVILNSQLTCMKWFCLSVCLSLKNDFVIASTPMLVLLSC